MSELVRVRPIRTEADYQAALNEIGTIMTARAGTPEGDRLDVLSTLVEAYEAEHYPIEAPDPVALIEFAMEQRGADRADLEPMIGPRGRVSEVLNRKRPLSLSMIRKLKDEWHLPADVLVRTYSLRKVRGPKHAGLSDRTGAGR
jgi:HTH-type transcriptional regulator/antitoxin HigA